MQIGIWGNSELLKGLPGIFIVTKDWLGAFFALEPRAQKREWWLQLQKGRAVGHPRRATAQEKR